jgi:hypothetical protein
MSPRRHESLLEAVKSGLVLPVAQHPEIQGHKFHRPTEAEMRRYRELENHRNARAHELAIDPTLIASRATLSELARDWDKHAPELMNWQRQQLQKTS